MELIPGNPKPDTINELEQWMKDHCYNFNSYSINGNFIAEGFGIDKAENSFVWYYTERGLQEPVKNFRTEKEAVEFAYEQISKDKWAQTHCIGYNYNQKLIQNLLSELNQLNIEYFQDMIPQNNQNNIYRVFVYGCDHKKVEHLKTIYFNNK